MQNTNVTEAKNIFKANAAPLASIAPNGDIELISKTDLANGYCDAEESGNKDLANAYWAALMLRYWYKIYDWSKTSRSCRMELEDYIAWLHESLMDAFYYRGWRWEYDAVVREGRFVEWKLDENGNKIPNEHYWKKDINAPDKSINFFLSARRNKEYQALNKDKRKSNMLSQSIEEGQEKVGDLSLEQLGAYSNDNHSVTSGVQFLITKFLHQGRTIEALIIDGIANQDSYKETKTSEKVIDVDEETGEEVEEKIEHYHYSLNERKLVKHLNQIDQKFMTQYFNHEYGIDDQEGSNILEKLKSLNNVKLYNYIRKTLVNLKQEPNIVELLTK